MTLQIGDAVSDLIRRLVRDSRTSGRHAGLSLSGLAYEAHCRLAIPLALTCAVVITPRMALGDPIPRQSPTIIVDTNAFEGQAFIVGADGIDQSTFFGLPGWSGGLSHGNGTTVEPSQWDDNAVWIAWTDNTRPRMNGFFNFEVGSTIWLATPFMELDWTNLQWTFNWAFTAPPVDGSFIVESGFGWINGRTGRLNIFGMTLPTPDGYSGGFGAVPSTQSGNGIRDLWWDGSTWNWFNHGRPSNTDEVTLGRNSAVWDRISQQGHVFAAASASDRRALPSLYDLFWDGSGWNWVSLGNPFGDPGSSDQVVEMHAPVVVDGVQNGVYVLTAFVVGLHGTNRLGSNPQYRWELFAREGIGSLIFGNTLWFDWINLGNPDNASFTDINSAGLFQVDQGVRWIDGNLLRGSLFGTNISNQLIDLFRGDNGWQWAPPVPLPQPQPPAAPISILSRISCAVLTSASSPGWHLTALMRDNTGRVWNRQFDSSSSTWTWQ